MKTNYIVEKTGNDIQIIISNVTLKGNLAANPLPEAERSCGKVTNFTALANYGTNLDATVIGSIIEAVREVCAHYHIQAPNFQAYLPITFGAWNKESERAQGELQKGTFVSMTGDIKVRSYINRAGIRKLEIHMGNNATYRVLAKGKTNGFNVAEDVFPFTQAI